MLAATPAAKVGYDHAVERRATGLRNARLAAVAVVLLALVLAHQLGVLKQFADPARTKQTLIDLGPRGYVGFVGAFAMLQPFGVPGRCASSPRR